MEDFIFRAILSAIGISIIAGSLGCFVIWKRMSYFSESISHSALLGVSLGLASGLGMHFGLIVSGGIFAVFIVILHNRAFLSNDTILGIFSHIALSVGIVVLALIDEANTDYFSLLFGDILSIDNQDIIWIYAVLAIVVSVLLVFWQRLLLLTLCEDLAKAEGLKSTFYQLLFMLMVALSVSVSVQIIGVLLMTSLLIIPAAIAKTFARSPVQMVAQSVFISIITVLMGLWISVYYDLATGPLIVIVLGFVFVLSQLLTTKKSG